MKTVLITFILVLASLTASAQSNDWTNTDMAMQATVTAALIVDWHQTREAMANPQAYREMNPMIGHSARAVNQYFAGAIIGSAALAYVLPQPWRERFQAGTLAVEIVAIGHNKSLGLRVSF
jgi:hypothetical protein